MLRSCLILRYIRQKITSTYFWWFYHATHRFDAWKEVMIFFHQIHHPCKESAEIIAILSVKVLVRWRLYTGKGPTPSHISKTKNLKKKPTFFWPPHFSMGISLVHALFQFAAPPKQQVIGDCGNHQQRFLVSAWTAEGSTLRKVNVKRHFEGYVFSTQIFRAMKSNLKTFAYYVYIYIYYILYIYYIYIL